MTDHVEQPMPVRNGHPSIQSMVRADLAEWTDRDVSAALVASDLVKREQVGIERYKTSLQPWNGRDALRDGYEEVVDLACYLKQAIVEGHTDLTDIYESVLNIACHIRRKMIVRDGQVA